MLGVEAGDSSLIEDSLNSTLGFALKSWFWLQIKLGLFVVKLLDERDVWALFSNLVFQFVKLLLLNAFAQLSQEIVNLNSNGEKRGDFFSLAFVFN